MPRKRFRISFLQDRVRRSCQGRSCYNRTMKKSKDDLFRQALAISVLGEQILEYEENGTCLLYEDLTGWMQGDKDYAEFVELAFALSFQAHEMAALAYRDSFAVLGVLDEFQEYASRPSHMKEALYRASSLMLDFMEDLPGAEKFCAALQEEPDGYSTLEELARAMDEDDIEQPDPAQEDLADALDSLSSADEETSLLQDRRIC